ncbi:hypothetical protein [Aquibacillus sediminis]|uniref:hypothetical protein n=1 Tax=Aquibacillus sediminis TaxID=2574734 RepID=UPI0011090B01|nr:hypothetical protein [Aquibacillus sediminis]
MFVLSRRLMVKEKIDRLNNGYNAFAESDDLVQRLNREIEDQQMPVICEVTDNGCWFFPEQNQ